MTLDNISTVSSPPTHIIELWASQSEKTGKVSAGGIEKLTSIHNPAISYVFECVYAIWKGGYAVSKGERAAANRY